MSYMIRVNDQECGQEFSYMRLLTVAARGPVMAIETGEETEGKNRFA